MSNAQSLRTLKGAQSMQDGNNAARYDILRTPHTQLATSWHVLCMHHRFVAHLIHALPICLVRCAQVQTPSGTTELSGVR